MTQDAALFFVMAALFFLVAMLVAMLVIPILWLIGGEVLSRLRTAPPTQGEEE